MITAFRGKKEIENLTSIAQDTDRRFSKIAKLKSGFWHTSGFCIKREMAAKWMRFSQKKRILKMGSKLAFLIIIFVDKTAKNSGSYFVIFPEVPSRSSIKTDERCFVYEFVYVFKATPKPRVFRFFRDIFFEFLTFKRVVFLEILWLIRSMSTRVYVGGLSHRTRERDIEKFFKKFGRIREISLKVRVVDILIWRRIENV